MQTTIPTSSTVLASLLRADFKTQWRNRRAVIMVVLVPVIIALSWKGLVATFGGPFVLSNCITVGLTAIGLMGYSNSIARDRDKGIFQRLRVAPVRSWSIMASRLIVQLTLILIVAAAVFFVGYKFDNITLTPSGYIMGFVAALVGGAVYLSLGQAIVGLIKNAETVSSTTRLVYFLFIMVGMLGELYAAMGKLDPKVVSIIDWSPYGTVKRILSAGMQPTTWDQHDTMAMLVTIGYAAVFTGLGIKWFKWNSK